MTKIYALLTSNLLLIFFNLQIFLFPLPKLLPFAILYHFLFVGLCTHFPHASSFDFALALPAALLVGFLLDDLDPLFLLHALAHQTNAI